MGAENAFRAVTQRIGNRARQGLSRAGNKLGLQGPHPIRSFYTNKDISPFTKAIMTPGLGLGVAVGEPIALGFKGVRKGAELGKRLANTEVAKRLNPLSEAKRQARHDRNLGKKIENSTQEAGDVLRNLAKAPLDDAGVPTLTRTEPSAPAADLPAPDPRVEQLGLQAQLTPDGAQVTLDGAADALGSDIQRLMAAGNTAEQAKAILANNALQAANNSQSGENAVNATSSADSDISSQPVSTSAETSAPATVDAKGTNPNLSRQQSADNAVTGTFTEEPGGQSGQSTTSNDAGPIHIKLPPNTTQAPDSTFTAAQTHTADPGTINRAPQASRQAFDASVSGNASGSPDASTNGNAPGSADTSPATSTPDASADTAADAGATATGATTPDTTASSTGAPDTTNLDTQTPMTPKEIKRMELQAELLGLEAALKTADKREQGNIEKLQTKIKRLKKELIYLDNPGQRKKDMIDDYRNLRDQLKRPQSVDDYNRILGDAQALREQIIDLDARGVPGVDVARAARGVIDGMPRSSRFQDPKLKWNKRDRRRFGKELRWMKKGLQGDMEALKRLGYTPPEVIETNGDKDMANLLKRIRYQNMAPQSFGEFAGNLAQKIFNHKNYQANYAARVRATAAEQAQALTATPEELDKLQRKYGKKITWWMNILLTVGMAITAEVINEIGPAAFQDASGRQ